MSVYLHSELVLAKYLQSGLKVTAIPQVGLPVVTPAGVELDPDGIPSVTATLNIPTLFPADPESPPRLQSAEFKLENGSPTVILTGSNFLNNSNDLGGKFEDLTVSFRVGDKTYPGILIPEKNTDLGENRSRIAVRVRASQSCLTEAFENLYHIVIVHRSPFDFLSQATLESCFLVDRIKGNPSY